MQTSGPSEGGPPIKPLPMEGYLVQGPIPVESDTHAEARAVAEQLHRALLHRDPAEAFEDAAGGDQAIGLLPYDPFLD